MDPVAVGRCRRLTDISFVVLDDVGDNNGLAAADELQYLTRASAPPHATSSTPPFSLSQTFTDPVSSPPALLTGTGGPLPNPTRTTAPGDYPALPLHLARKFNPAALRLLRDRHAFAAARRRPRRVVEEAIVNGTPSEHPTRCVPLPLPSHAPPPAPPPPFPAFLPLPHPNPSVISKAADQKEAGAEQLWGAPRYPRAALLFRIVTPTADVVCTPHAAGARERRARRGRMLPQLAGGVPIRGTGFGRTALDSVEDAVQFAHLPTPCRRACLRCSAHGVCERVDGRRVRATRPLSRFFAVEARGTSLSSGACGDQRYGLPTPEWPRRHASAGHYLGRESSKNLSAESGLI
ncbi:hypothetical protein DFH09DRAFT_1372688 [Mycena vulgaris]|nr:hypothetical protein DFH09DRAFT_1372688 [Mycena vulgaris]